MADCFSVVSDIKELLAFGHAADPARVVSVANDYNALVQNAIRRLGECCDAVNKGQHAHAIYLADTPPVLLDVIAALDLDDLHGWNSLARQFGAPPAPFFNAGLVQMLQDAYTHNEALEPLQKNYRRLVLKGGSTKEKLDLLRRIRQLDPSNPNWTQDISALETVRIKEIAAHVNTNEKTLKETDAAGLVRELTRQDLAVKPSETLIKNVKTLQLKLKSQRVLAAMDALVARLNEAYAARDFSVADACLNELDALKHNEGIAWPSNLLPAIQDARAWRAEQIAATEKQKEYEQSLAVLEGMLDDEAKPAEVKRYLRQFEYTDGHAPAGLMERAHGYVQRHELTEQRRRQGKLALIAVGVLLVAGLGAWAVWSVRDGRQRTAAALEIRNATSAFNFAEADKVVKKLKEESPRMLEDVGIKQAVEELERARQEENTRRAQLKAIAARAEQTDALAPEMDVLLVQAETLARTKEEKDAVSEWKANTEIKRGERAKTAMEEAGTLLAEADALLNKLKSLDDADALKPLLEQMDTVLRKAELVRGLPKEIAEQVKSYRIRLSNEQERASKLAALKSENQAKSAKARAAVLSLRESIKDDLKGYSAGLMRRRDEYSMVSPEFRDAGKWEQTVPAYVAALDWGEEVQRLMKQNARAAYKDFREWLAKHPVQAAAASPYRSVMQKQLARANFYANAKENLAGLRALLKHDLMTRLCEFSVEEKSATTLYYTHDKAAPKDVNGSGDPSLEIEVFLDDTLTPERKTFSRKSAGKISESPHVTLGREIAKLIDGDANAPVWTPSLPKAIRLVNNAATADPYVRALLLNKLLVLDSQHVKSLQLSPELLKKVSDLCAEKISFWLPKESVRTQLDKLAVVLKEIHAELDDALNAFDAGGEKMEIQALYRPLFLSAVVETGDNGMMKILPLPGMDIQKEYWSIEPGNEGAFVFKIAAIAGDGGQPHWVEGEKVYSGQPLLSPKDGSSTLELAAKFSAGKSDAPPPFPANLDAVRKSK